MYLENLVAIIFLLFKGQRIQTEKCAYIDGFIIFKLFHSCSNVTVTNILEHLGPVSTQWFFFCFFFVFCFFVFFFQAEKRLHLSFNQQHCGSQHKFTTHSDKCTKKFSVQTSSHKLTCPSLLLEFPSDEAQDRPAWPEQAYL